MPRSDRLFELIQILRAAPGVRTAQALAEALEVSPRTIYRDIAALQAMRVPVEGAAGFGYLLRGGYDLPPLNFDQEETEALRVGLAMLARTGDTALQRAARRVCDKVDALHGPADWLFVAPWGAPADTPQDCVSIAMLRQAIRDEGKLALAYRSETAEMTRRTVRPIVLIYHLDCTMLTAWCELRGDFRHFRTDRIYGCTRTGAHFPGEGAVLRDLWRQREAVAADPPAAPA